MQGVWVEAKQDQEGVVESGREQVKNAKSEITSGDVFRLTGGTRIQRRR